MLTLARGMVYHSFNNSLNNARGLAPAPKNYDTGRNTLIRVVGERLALADPHSLFGAQLLRLFDLRRDLTFINSSTDAYAGGDGGTGPVPPDHASFFIRTMWSTDKAQSHQCIGKQALVEYGQGRDFNGCIAAKCRAGAVSR